MLKIDKWKTVFQKYTNLYFKLWAKVSFFVIGIGSLVWFLIRVVPKPSRANYPCMKAAAPIASSFVLYLLGLAASISAFKNGKLFFQKSNYLKSIALFFICLVTGGIAISQLSNSSIANQKIVYEFNDPLGPNNPIGEAKGIFPGRVVWVFDRDATNENCTNRKIEDAYFQDSNTNQAVVDKMFSDGLQQLTGKSTDSDAWDAIFKYFNLKHDKGKVGYDSSETVFIKINAVSAWSGIGTTGEMKYLPDDSDTTPQAILTMLRQLVYKAGVVEHKIFLGDPIAGIWNHIYDKLYQEFPNVNYIDEEGIVKGRTKLVASEVPGVTYSDKGTVLSIDSHYLYKSMMDADYLLNIPVMKGHRWGGVTLFAKNHFGSNTNGTSWQLHAGLINNDNKELRTGYKKYRVLTDLMGSKHLGRNTLLFFMDALWSTSYEHQKPQKFRSAPFNGDWSSSFLFSLDQVAIESVCIDILQKEFVEEDLKVFPPRFIYVQWDGVDDYLHQAASSEWWPDGITYDPDNSGTPMPSLGVHEHWNNVDDMEYSRNLGVGNGIELLKLFNEQTDVATESNLVPSNVKLFQNYPNPFNPTTTIKFEIVNGGNSKLEIFDISGRLIDIVVDKYLSSGSYSFSWDASHLSSGMYIYRLTTGHQTISKKMSLLK